MHILASLPWDSSQNLHVQKVENDTFGVDDQLQVTWFVWLHTSSMTLCLREKQCTHNFNIIMRHWDIYFYYAWNPDWRHFMRSGMKDSLETLRSSHNETFWNLSWPKVCSLLWRHLNELVVDVYNTAGSTHESNIHIYVVTATLSGANPVAYRNSRFASQNSTHLLRVKTFMNLPDVNNKRRSR